MNTTVLLVSLVLVLPILESKTRPPPQYYGLFLLYKVTQNCCNSQATFRKDDSKLNTTRTSAAHQMVNKTPKISRIVQKLLEPCNQAFCDSLKILERLFYHVYPGFKNTTRKRGILRVTSPLW
jgi:hypothetical protein